MWSTGGVIGSSIASVLLAAGIAPRVHILIASGVILLLLAWASPHILTIQARPRQESEVTKKGFILPNRRLALLILVGLTALFAEGTAFDWSGVFLRDYRQASPSESAMGFVAFTFAMTLVRFMGDLIIPRFGERNLLFGGGLLGASGLLLAVFGETLWTGWLGFLLLGLGCSLGAPMLFKMSMRLPGVPPATGLATFSTFSFLGFLLGPPVIGWISKAYGLPLGLMIVAGFLSLGAIVAKKFI
jgi:predicted MFS family arabinose efflux permease